jgi:menaquinone-specific isochorismate synthase
MNNGQTEGGAGIDTRLTSAVAAKLLEKLSDLEKSETQFPTTVRVAAPGLNVWQWLHANREQTRIVWSNRDSSEVIAGVGAAAIVSLTPNSSASECIAKCRSILGGNADLKFFGGFSFDGTDGWEAFGAGRFAIPRLLFSRGELTLAILDAEDIGKAKLELQQIRCDAEPYAKSMPAPTGRSYTPTVDGWQSRVDEALSLIRSEVLEKIVLSRRATLDFDQPLNPIALTQRLKETTHDCFVFCFDFGSSSAFLGATPERLFLRKEKQLQSEVVAGTRARGETPDADEKLAIELLTSDKDQREHDIVRKSIRQKLHKFVDHLDVDNQASILRLTWKQHLRSNVQGTLKEDVDDGVLLQRLHPTPAVGGYPTENALPEIARIEPFNRGWFAAPIGWIGADSVEFAVGIRSGLIEGNALSLYSGAGIVRGSDPDQEWQEVENKIQDFISVLGQ